MVDARKVAEVMADDLEGVTERESRVVLLTGWIERIMVMATETEPTALQLGAEARRKGAV